MLARSASSRVRAPLASRPVVVLLIVCCAAITACGSSKPAGGPTSESATSADAVPTSPAAAPTSPGKAPTSPSSTSLPLQSRGLAIGGDAQTRATEVVSVRITRQQAQELAARCEATVQVASTSDGCGRGMIQSFTALRLACSPTATGSGCPDQTIECSPANSPPDGGCITIHTFNGQDAAAGGLAGFVQIDGPLCGSTTCLRVGLVSAALHEVAAKAPPVASKPPVTASPSPRSPTATATSRPTPTPAPAGATPAKPRATSSASSVPSARP